MPPAPSRCFVSVLFEPQSGVASTLDSDEGQRPEGYFLEGFPPLFFPPFLSPLSHDLPLNETYLQ